MIIVVRIVETRDFGCTIDCILCSLYLMILLLSVVWLAANVPSLSDPAYLGFSFLGHMTFFGKGLYLLFGIWISSWLESIGPPFDSILLLSDQLAALLND